MIEFLISCIIISIKAAIGGVAISFMITALALIMGGIISITSMLFKD